MTLMSRPVGRRRPAAAVAASTAALLVLLLGYTTILARPARAAGALLSQGRAATASSAENATFGAGLAVDGSAGTRWSSAFSDPQWLQVDLGQTASIDQVTLSWEAAYARSFQIQTSADAATWTTIFSTGTGAGGTQTLAVTGSGRYVRMLGTVRGTAFGYSLWEFQVFGSFGGSTGCNTANVAQGRTATASSTENAATGAALAVDGNAATRWSSAFADPQWLQVDLGGTVTVCQVILTWEAAYASAFQVQLSANANGPWTNIFGTTTGAGGTQTLNVTGTGRYLRMNGTARGTAFGYSLWELAVHITGAAPPPPTNPPTNDAFWGDTSTIPPAQNVLTVKILNKTNGHYPDSQVFWNFNGQTHSIAEQQYLDMPANSAGRMYFYLGSPNSQYFDFIEFTVGPAVFNGNTTRVDAFGLKLALRLHAHDGFDTQVGEDQATFAEDRSVTFQKFQNEVPTEFKHLATVQAPFRIPAPGSDADFRAGGQFQNYFTGYASSVGINTTTSDVTGCAGVLASQPDQCAALNRHVAQLPQSQWGTPGNYYLAAPANYYARFWHDHAINHLAYGFPYDDVAGQSSFISHGNPQYLLVAVGW